MLSRILFCLLLAAPVLADEPSCVVTPSSNEFINIDLGDVFLGRTLEWSIQFKNDTERDVSLANLFPGRSAIGESDIKRIRHGFEIMLSPGESVNLPLKITGRHVLECRDEASVEIDGRRITFPISFRVLSRLKFADAVFDKDGNGSTTVEVMDPEYNPKDVRLRLGTSSCRVTSIKVRDRTITLNLKRNMEVPPTSWFLLHASHNRVIDVVAGIRSIHHGVLGVSPSEVLVRKSQDKVRLFLAGDRTGIKEGKVLIPIKIGDETLNVDFDCERGRFFTAILTAGNFCRELSVGKHKVVMDVAGLPVAFELVVAGLDDKKSFDEMITNYALHYEEFGKRRFAFVGRGKSVLDKDKKETNYWSIAVVDGDKTLHASSRSIDSNVVVYREIWKQELVAGGVVSTRGDPHHKALTRHSKGSGKISNPLDQVFDNPVYMLRNAGTPAPRQFEQWMQLSGGRYDEEITTEEDTEAGDFHVLLNSKRSGRGTTGFTFTKRSGFFPGEITTKNGGNLKIEWKDFGPNLKLPIKCTGSFLHHGRDLTSLEYEFDWLLDDDVPANLIDKDLPDWREPVRKLFGVEWQRRDVPLEKRPARLEMVVEYDPIVNIRPHPDDEFGWRDKP